MCKIGLDLFYTFLSLNDWFMKYLVVVIVALSMVACTPDSEKEKFQGSRNIIIDVRDSVKEFDTGDILIGSVSRFCVGNGFLCIADHKSFENPIHVFSLSDYRHLISFGMIGPGPYEITRLGHIEIDEEHEKMYINDHGKNRILSYDLDSLMAFPESYKHCTKAQINETYFPASYFYVNDTLSYIRAIQPTSVSTFDQAVAKWNMQTGKMEIMPYTHPAIENKRSLFDVSIENGFYVEAYLRHDLLSICDLDGNLICNIYGPDWNGGGKSKLSCFGDVMVTNENIIATYSGGDYNEDYYPTKVQVFDLTGDYIKTLNVGYKITDCCYDEINNRIVMAFDDEIQFGYLDLNTLI